MQKINNTHGPQEEKTVSISISTASETKWDRVSRVSREEEMLVALVGGGQWSGGGPSPRRSPWSLLMSCFLPTADSNNFHPLLFL